MADTNLGRVGFVPRGLHNSGASYSILDTVVYAKNGYCCIKDVPANSGILPTNTEYFTLYVEKGDPGSPGPTSIGPAGPAFTFADFTPSQLEALRNGIAASQVVITPTETNIGKITLLGVEYNLYQMLIEITNNIPAVANAEATFVLSDIPIGFNLFLDVKSFVAAADSQVIVADYYNHLYKVQRIFVDTDLATKITIKCLETIPVDVKINLQVQYIKDPGDILELNITVPVGINPANVNLSFPALKYNKKNVASISLDDTKPTWNNVFSPINKKWVDNELKQDLGLANGNIVMHKDWTETINGVYFDRSTGHGHLPAKFLEYSDGAGIRHRYGFGLACSWWWLSDNTGAYSDVTTPEWITYGRTFQASWAAPATTAKELLYMQKFGVAVEIHDMYIPFLEGKTSYDSMTQDEFNAAVLYDREKYLGLIDHRPIIGTRPGGNEVYFRFLDCPYILFSYIGPNADGLYNHHGYYYKPFADSLPLSRKDLLPYREFWAPGYTLADFKNKIISEYAKPLADRVWNAFGTHDIYQDSGFEEAVVALEADYGISGDDSLWFAAMQEIMEYSWMKYYASVGKSINGQNIKFKIHIPFVNDFRFKSISCLLSSITSLTGVTVSSSSNCEGLSCGISDGQLLVNLDFNGNLLDIAEDAMTVAENMPIGIGAFLDAEKIGAIEDAEYFLQKIKPELKSALTTRLNILKGAPNISSFRISNAETTATKNVTLFITATGSPVSMKISEDPTFTGVSPIPFSSQVAFTLSSGFTLKRVYAVVLNAFAEQSERVDDTITYVEAPLTCTGLLINDGSTSTNNSLVSVEFVKGGDPTYYALAESLSELNAIIAANNFTAFAAGITYQLSTTPGTKTLYGVLKNGSTTTSVVQQSIQLIDINAIAISAVVVNSNAGEASASPLSVALTITGTATKYKLADTEEGLASASFVNYPGGTLSHSVSYAYGSGKKVWAQVQNALGVNSAPKDSAAFVYSAPIQMNTNPLINANAASTTDRNVSILLQGIVGTPTHYSIGEVSNPASPTWVAFTAGQLANMTISYQLSVLVGSSQSKTVYIKVKRRVGNVDLSISAERFDAITLNAAPAEAIKAVISLSREYGNGILEYSTVGALTYNKTNAASGTGSDHIADKLLKSTTGTNLAGWYYIHDAAHYPAVAGESSLTESALLGGDAAPLSGNAGPYPDECIAKQAVTSMFVSATKKSRIVLTLPVGSYTFKIIMSTASSASIDEAMRPYCFYKVTANGISTDPVVVGPSGFTGLGNVNFNAELSFDVTSASDGNVIFWIWNSVPGDMGYRPAVNLIEISKTA